MIAENILSSSSSSSSLSDMPPHKKAKTEYIYPSTLRTVSVHSITSKQHPLNVKPAGNSLLASDPDLLEKRKKLLGKLSILPNELILLIISYIPDAKTLLSISHTSRILYALISDEENWKQIYVRNIAEYDNRPWLGSWRNTVLGIPWSDNANLQLESNLLCCDEIYRPVQCSQIDYKKLFAKILVEEETYHRDSLLNQLGKLPKGRILRIAESELDVDEFNTIYHNTPFILTNSDTTRRWPQWTFELLFQRFPHVKFRQEAVSWDLEKYSQYLNHNCDENPLYLFDCNSDAMKQLKKEYEPPKIFQDDLFKVFQQTNLGFNCRPDHAWLIMGSARSGSTFHKDPNSTSAWNVAIQGRKLWIMLPPNVQPPGVSTDDEESEVTSPVGIAEWVISGFYNDSVRLDEVQIGVTFPGECMYVPAGWWHSVINIDDSIAITQNFVPQSKLPHVLNFFKNKPKQISGFRIKQVKQCLDLLVKKSTEDEGLLNYVEQLNNKLNNKLGLNGETVMMIDDEEDCGEITDLPQLPIFEIFKQLLVNDGKEEMVNDALQTVQRWEEKAYMNETGRSKAWEKLTEVNETSAFSFGFSESDSE